MRSPETSKIIKGSKISLQVRTGEAWYQKFAREMFYFTLRTFPGTMISKMTSEFTPTFADEEFMAEVKKQLETAVWPVLFVLFDNKLITSNTSWMWILQSDQCESSSIKSYV